MIVESTNKKKEIYQSAYIAFLKHTQNPSRERDYLSTAR